MRSGRKAEGPAAGGGWAVDRKTSWLRRYVANEQEIARLRQEIESWEALALPSAPRLGCAVGGGAAGSSVERLYERVEALREALVAELDRRVTLRFEMEGAISALADERHQLVLRLRFIEGLSLEAAAERMHYSFRQVCNLSAKAIGLLVVPGES